MLLPVSLQHQERSVQSCGAVRSQVFAQLNSPDEAQSCQVEGSSAFWELSNSHLCGSSQVVKEDGKVAVSSQVVPLTT